MPTSWGMAALRSAAKNPQISLDPEALALLRNTVEETAPSSNGMGVLLSAANNPEITLDSEALALIENEKAKKKKGKNKFGAVKVVTDDGLKFDSKAEYAHYGLLRYRELMGEISDLKTQPVLELHAGVRYIGDFKYFDKSMGKWVIADVKGGKATQTQSFRDKWKQAIEKYPEFHFEKVVTNSKKRGQRRERK